MAWWSMLWTTGTTGDGAASGYTQAQTIQFFRALLNGDITDEGFLKSYLNEAAPTAHNDPASPYVTVATGGAIVYGFPVFGDAAENISLTLPVVGDTGFRIVLRLSGGVTRTGRLALLQSADGNNAIPAVTQDANFPDTAGTVWEISICTGVVDTAGDIWKTAAKAAAGVTDTRVFLHPNVELEYAMAKLGEFWAAGGNTDGAALVGGTQDAYDVELDVDGNQMLLLDTDGNVIGGGQGTNAVTATVSGATIAGGVSNVVTDDHGTIGGGESNQAGDDAGTVNDAEFATVGGGEGNRAEGKHSTVAGGAANVASGEFAGILSGNANVASAEGSGVTHGAWNQAETKEYTLAGGLRAEASLYGQAAFASGYFGDAFGDAQRSDIVARAEVTHSDANWHSLYLDGVAEALTVRSDEVIMMDIMIVGTDSGCTNRFVYHIWGSVHNDGGAGAAIIQQSVTTFAESDANFDAQLAVAGNNVSIQMQDTGSSGLVIHWVASVRMVHVRYP